MINNKEKTKNNCINVTKDDEHANLRKYLLRLLKTKFSGGKDRDKTISGGIDRHKQISSSVTKWKLEKANWERLICSKKNSLPKGNKVLLGENKTIRTNHKERERCACVCELGITSPTRHILYAFKCGGVINKFTVIWEGWKRRLDLFSNVESTKDTYAHFLQCFSIARNITLRLGRLTLCMTHFLVRESMKFWLPLTRRRQQ